mgnify:CR=1 FL=1
MQAPLRIAVLASGSGSNAERLVRHFRHSALAEVVLIGCDRPEAGVLQRAWDLGVPTYVFNGASLRDGSVLDELRDQRVDLLVLAGFLRLLPEALVRHFNGRAINIHPSLLPKHGGKGMYGDRVHEAVLAAGEQESGITVHLVNERFDEGRVLHQERCPVLPGDTVRSLAQRIHALEHEHFPVVVEQQCRELAGV